MKRIAQLFVLLLLLASPTVAAVQVTDPDQSNAVERLQAADEALSAATEALIEVPDDKDLLTIEGAAETEYDAALDAARLLRDESDEGNSGELGQAIYRITTDGSDASVSAIADMVTDWTTNLKTWVTEEGPDLFINAVIGLLIIFVFNLLGKLAGRILDRALSSTKFKISSLLKKFFVAIVQKLTLFVGVLIALEQINVNTAPLLAGIGVVGFVVGFALQDTLGNFASGIMILLYRPFDVGDFISAAGESGSVNEMTLVSTTLITIDNQKLIIPNSSIWGGTIRNVTALSTRRVDMVVGVSYSDDLDKTQAILMEVISAHESVLESPEPQVCVSNLGESSVDFVVRPWCKTGDYWDVRFDLTKSIKQRLDEEGISIPFPQRDLHVIEVPADLQKGA